MTTIFSYSQNVTMSFRSNFFDLVFAVDNWSSVSVSSGCSLGVDNGGRSVTVDSGCNMDHLGVSATVFSVSGGIVSSDSISLSSILVVSAISVMSSTGVCSKIVVCFLVVNAIASLVCAIVGNNSMMSGFLVISVSFFVASSLVLGVSSYITVFSILGSLGTISIMSSICSDIVLCLGCVGLVSITSMISIVGLSVSSISGIVLSMGAISVTSRRGSIGWGGMVDGGHWVRFSGF
ncbi:hypothetical protein X975_08904, partial [Stegodyphus mimosarum]